jgi:excinuclease UvrABC ATPase subunit
MGACIGSVVGLVAITPAAGYVSMPHAIFIGVFSSLVSNLTVSKFPKGKMDDALDVFTNKLKLDEQEMTIARLILKEIMARLGFMSNVGLSYLELGRAANTLSGGEAQRIRLATQIGSGLRKW